MVRSWKDSAIDGHAFPCSSFPPKRALACIFSAAMNVGAKKSKVIAPDIRYEELCVVKRTSLTMSATPWVMNGGSSMRHRASSLHAYSNTGWKLSLYAVSNTKQIGVRRYRSTTCADWIRKSHLRRKVMAVFLWRFQELLLRIGQPW